MWLIWSIEHEGWWGPNMSGYTQDRALAGRYTFEGAQAIVREANEHRPPDAAPNEAMVPAEPR